MGTSDLIAKLFLSYPSANPSRQAMALYVDALKDIPEELLAVGIRKLVNTSKFLPSIAEIREACEDLFDEKPMWEDGWTEVMDAMTSSFSKHGPGRWSNSVIARTVKALGWDNMRCMTYQNMPVWRSQFRETFNRLIERDERDYQNRIANEQLGGLITKLAEQRRLEGGK